MRLWILRSLAMALITTCLSGLSASAAPAYDGTWSGTLTGTKTLSGDAGDYDGPCCDSGFPIAFTITNGVIPLSVAKSGASVSFVGKITDNGIGTLTATINTVSLAGLLKSPCTFQVAFKKSGTADSIGAISCQFQHLDLNTTVRFNGSFHAVRTSSANPVLTSVPAKEVALVTAKLAVPKGATVTLRVAPASSEFCVVSTTKSGTFLNYLKDGLCKVTVTVNTKINKVYGKKTVVIAVRG